MMKPRSAVAIDKHIGARIRMRRHELGISQEKLAQPLGLTFQQVQKYENATNRVSGSRMAQIAAILDVDVGFFYEGAMPASWHIPNGKNGAHAPALMDNFMASKDGLVIAEAFVRIKDPEVRHVVAAAVAKIFCAL